jgi:hypothetical protein
MVTKGSCILWAGNTYEVAQVMSEKKWMKSTVNIYTRALFNHWKIAEIQLLDCWMLTGKEVAEDKCLFVTED